MTSWLTAVTTSEPILLNVCFLREFAALLSIRVCGTFPRYLGETFGFNCFPPILWSRPGSERMHEAEQVSVQTPKNTPPEARCVVPIFVVSWL